MKFLVFLCVVAAASAVYTDVDETIDIDAIMADPNKLRPYMDCYLDKKPCTDQAKAFKGHIAEMISTGCRECDDRLKHIVEEFILDVLVLYPAEAAQLKAKYDSGNKLGNLALEVAKY